MKKYFRIIALSLSFILLALNLCSCSIFDKIKYTDDSKQAVVYKGNTYKLLDIDDDEYKVCINGSSEGKAEVTENWLADLFRYPREWGYHMYIYDNQTILTYTNDDESTSYFIREDKYDDYADAIEKAESDRRYYLSIPNTQEDDGGQQTEENIPLDEATNALINKAKASSKDELIRNEDIFPEDKTLYVIRLDIINDNDLILDVSDAGSLIKDNDKYYIKCNNFTRGSYNIYTPSDEESELIKKIFDKYPNAVKEKKA